MLIAHEGGVFPEKNIYNCRRKKIGKNQSSWRIIVEKRRQEFLISRVKANNKNKKITVLHFWLRLFSFIYLFCFFPEEQTKKQKQNTFYFSLICSFNLHAWICTAWKAIQITWAPSSWTQGPTWTRNSWQGTITHKQIMPTTVRGITTATRPPRPCSTPTTPGWTVNTRPTWPQLTAETPWPTAATTSSVEWPPTNRPCRWQQLVTCQPRRLSTARQFRRPHTSNSLRCRQGDNSLEQFFRSKFSYFNFQIIWYKQL